MIEKDYTDKKGIPRRALVESELSPPEKGILTSIYLDEFLEQRGCSTEFRKKLIIEMQKRGLVTPADVLYKPNSAELLRAALQSALLMDVQTILAIAKEQFDNARQHNSKSP